MQDTVQVKQLQYFEISRLKFGPIYWSIIKLNHI